ncbi:IclR family transcriptional regulator [Acrocarpospora pleiomorpha]|nr:helix-turn-helix domain-containing protein [Acrocarpospora pleiomorpha]
MADRDRNSSQTVEKAMRVLRFVGTSERPVSVAEISAGTGYSATSIQRAIRALEKEGALARCTASSRVQIGWMIRGLSQGHEWHDLLKASSRAVLSAVQRRCGEETVGLYVGIGTVQFMCIDTLAGLHGLTHIERLYQPIEMARGATSQVFLAQRLARFGLEPLREFMKENFHLDDADEAKLESLIGKVQDTRSLGYSESESTRFPGLHAISVPVLSKRGETLAALTVSGASSRFVGADTKGWVSQCLLAAEEISSRYHSELAREQAREGGTGITHPV